MQIKEISARKILDSRKEPTIEISVETERGRFKSSAPSGESKGKFEARSYAKNLQTDINFIKKLKTEELNKCKIDKFKDLKEVEGLVGRKIGANSLFVLEASILKALAAEEEKELWEFLSRGKIKFPFPVGNAIGGGLHSYAKRPDFQEFLFISKTDKFFDRVFINKQAYKIADELVPDKKISDEGAWWTSLDNEKVLEIMNIVQHEIKKKFGEEIDIGIDVAGSTFFRGNHYNYKNEKKRLNKEQQINYIAKLAKTHGLNYIEDPLQEDDFYGFAELRKKTRSMIVGDDLTVTNLTRLKKAVQTKSISAVIVKPNQNGSLLAVKEIMDFCRDKGIKTILSHRSGETMDNTIADLAVAWKADFIKTGIRGKEREVKLNRIIQIEKSLKQ
jgi:enolase